MRAALLTPALELRHVVKDYAVGMRGMKLRAVDHVSLSVGQGQVFSLLGPNGSGKSTALKLMAGLITPSSGTATILGRPSEEPASRRAIGYVPESPRFPARFTGRELIEFAGRLGGLDCASARRRGAEMLGLVGLAGAADRLVHGYSKGMQQRLGLAQALVHDPGILILDEPAAGLDPVGLGQFGALIQQLKAAGRTVLLTSHHLAQVQEFCDVAAILEAGRLRWSGPIERGSPVAGLEEIYFQHVAAGGR